MPRDTPPATMKPKAQLQRQQPPRIEKTHTPAEPVTKAAEPIIPKQGPSDTIEEAFLRAGAITIESAPILRDLQKEAVAFIPSAVKRRPPPKKALPKEMKVEQEESLSKTVEDVAPVEIEPVAETILKRPLPVEAKSEPEHIPPPAAPKRRRMVNAAPDV